MLAPICPERRSEGGNGMRIVIFLVSALPLCGIFAYVLVQLRRDERQLNGHKKHLQKHLYEREPESPNARAKRIVKTVNSRIALKERGTQASFERPLLNPTVNIVAGSNLEALARRETIICLIIGVGGLAALFAGIEYFNSLVTWAH